MKREIKTILALDGEKQFKEAVKGINTNLAVLGSEMEKATSAFSRNDKSAKKLKATNDVLRKQIDQQKTKVAEYANALRQAESAYGKNSKEATDYRIKMNKAEAALNKMNVELKENVASIKAQSKEAAQSKISALTDKLKAAGGALGKGVGYAAKGAAIAVAAVGTAAAVAAKQVWDAAKETGTWADDLLTLSAKTGVSTKNLQEFQYASRFVDVEVETMTDSMARLIRSMSSGTDKTKGTGKAFAQLGIKVADSKGQLRDNKTVWLETIDALGKIENETQRDALAMQIFGKSAQDLNPLIKAGSSELKRLGEEAAAAGLILDNDAVASMGRFDDIMQKTQAQAQGLKRQLVVNLMPALQGIGTGLSDIMTDVGAALKDGFQAEDIKTIGASISKKLIDGMRTISAYLPQIIQTITDALNEAVKVVIAILPQLLPALFDAAMSLMQGLLDAIKQNLQPLMDMVVTMLLAFTDFLVKNLPLIIDVALQIIIALAIGIAKALPDLIPAILEMVDQIVNTLIYNLPLLVAAAIEIIVALAAGLIAALPKLIGKIPEIIDRVIKAFTEFDWSGLGGDLLSGIGKGIANGAGALFDSLKGALDKAIGDVKNFFGIHSPSTYTEKLIGKNLGLGIARGLDKSKNQIGTAMKEAIPASLETKYNMAIGAGYSASRSSIQHVHSGTLRIEGVTDKGQLLGVVDMVLGQLKTEAMLAGAR